MGASLIYYWRRCLLTTDAGGRMFQLPTHRTESSIYTWEKVQELRSGRITLWDHCFEVPHEPISGAASAGTVSHRIGIEPFSIDPSGGDGSKDDADPAHERAVTAARVLNREDRAELAHHGDMSCDTDVDPGLQLCGEAAVVEARARIGA